MIGVIPLEATRPETPRRRQGSLGAGRGGSIPGMSNEELTVWTIGHSTRELRELVDLLRDHGIRLLVDVRRFPTSRRFPHFKKEPLAKGLESAGIGYLHAPEMGGMRGDPAPDSPNDAWRAAGFQAYADHAASEEFQEALDRLIEEAGDRPTAIMCAEITPWRCHRQIIADHLVARGIRVLHIVDEERLEEHELASHARVLEGGSVIYPGGDEEQPSLLDDL